MTARKSLKSIHVGSDKEIELVHEKLWCKQLRMHKKLKRTMAPASVDDFGNVVVDVAAVSVGPVMSFDHLLTLLLAVGF